MKNHRASWRAATIDPQNGFSDEDGCNHSAALPGLDVASEFENTANYGLCI